MSNSQHILQYVWLYVCRSREVVFMTNEYICVVDPESFVLEYELHQWTCLCMYD